MRKTFLDSPKPYRGASIQLRLGLIHGSQQVLKTCVMISHFDRAMMRELSRLRDMVMIDTSQIRGRGCFYITSLCSEDDWLLHTINFLDSAPLQTPHVIDHWVDSLSNLMEVRRVRACSAAIYSMHRLL